ncbi:MAG: PEP-CTERM sorting domain-containing protein [Fimbriimonadaceae bacterium]|nr:PEP-CTERM sorting domain-containing protein [Fimbriimonadaceae bacterium]
MNKFAIIAGLIACIGVAQAQVGFTGLYTQNFDTLITTSSSSISGNLIPGSGMTGWETNRTSIIAGTGSSNAGGLYSFGTGTSTERALGSVTSGSTGPIHFGVRLRNDSGVTLTTLQISFSGEQWRIGGNAIQSLVFAYKLNPVTISESGYIPNSSFDFVGPRTGAAAAIDGNLALNRAVVSGTLNISGGWEAGDELMLRWTKDGTNSHGLALDDVKLFNPVPEPMTMGLLALGAFAARKRRNRKN